MVGLFYNLHTYIGNLTDDGLDGANCSILSIADSQGKLVYFRWEIELCIYRRLQHFASQVDADACSRNK